MRYLKFFFVVVLLFAASGVARAQSTPPDLDAIARQVIADQHVVGASILVMRGNTVLLHKGYGFADLGLEAPTKDETVYHIVGPMLPFTGVAVLQLSDRGKLSLDDDISTYIPEFPTQGRHVTIRNLLNHTSGIVDYHYLGDPIEATSRLPKALDEVMALYADKKWVHEPGTKWDWSISGFQLLVTVVERVSHQTFADYVQQNIFAPAGVKSTSFCDDFTLVPGLSHSYRRFGAGFVAANENDMAYNYDLRVCSTVGDIVRLWRAIQEKNLLQPQTYKQMSTAEGAAAQKNPDDPLDQYGLAVSINHEDDHRRIGQHGSLFGYSGSLYDFPADGLTIAVLTNTEGQNAYAIMRALARAVLGLAPLPSPRAAPERILADNPVSPAERSQLKGTFVLKLDRLSPDLHDSFAQYRRTYRVFDEDGRLMIQPLGEPAERLLKQNDGSFAMRSSPRSHINFAIENNRAVTLKMDPSALGVPLSGANIGAPDAATFHHQLQ
ncbi:MAG TPA: serine hydrolase domain-containing protein [Candidatus Acidoferrales bacterium]|jgi:CubicO group peptidase (beta-lactamase class C family)|nr:serine hydrolase domain-containing protein [Candidatus Acidoferrales bacterium]